MNGEERRKAYLAKRQRSRERRAKSLMKAPNMTLQEVSKRTGIPIGRLHRL